MTSGSFTWTPGEGAGAVASIVDDPESQVDEGSQSSLNSLLDKDLSVGVVILAILLAMGWGALHSLSPGHGKTMVAAYLVGTRGTARHALILGLFVTVTHTVGVVALDPDSLRKAGNNYLTGTVQANVKVGAIAQGALESSNVNTVSEMVALIENMREFEADQKVIRALDDTLGGAVNQVGRV